MNGAGECARLAPQTSARRVDEARFQMSKCAAAAPEARAEMRADGMKLPNGWKNAKSRTR